MTKPAFLNALTLVMATGGSANAIFHFLPIAKSVIVELTLDDFQIISDRTPSVAELKPSGRSVMEDLHELRQNIAYCLRNTLNIMLIHSFSLHITLSCPLRAICLDQGSVFDSLCEM